MTTAFASAFRTASFQYVTRGIQAGVDFAASDLAGEPGDGLMRYVRTTDIAGVRALKAAGVFAPRADVPDSARAREGDLLLTRAGSLGTAYLHAGDPVAVAGYLVRVQLDPSCEPRFYAYYCQSRPFLDALETRATQTTIQNFSASKYAALQVPVPSLGVQRRVADMLDAETARIDTLITKNREAAQIAATRRMSWMWHTVETLSTGAPHVPLWLLAQHITSGPRDWGDYVGEEGPFAFVRITNIQRDWFSLDRSQLLRVTPPPTDGQADRVRLRPGDVLVTITADLGSIGIVPHDLGPAVINQHVASVRIDPRACHPSWLAAVLRTVGRTDLLKQTYGGTKQGLALSDVQRVRVPVPLYDTQTDLAARLEEQDRSTEALLSRCEQLDGLLRTRRQALITAAVTGQITV